MLERGGPGKTSPLDRPETIVACAETNCPHEATHVIKICVPPVGGEQDENTAVTMIFGVRLCRRHAERFSVDQIMDVPNAKGGTLRNDLIPMAARQQGWILPTDTNRTWLVPVRIDSPEHKKVIGMLR